MGPIYGQKHHFAPLFPTSTLYSHPNRSQGKKMLKTGKNALKFRELTQSGVNQNKAQSGNTNKNIKLMFQLKVNC